MRLAYSACRPRVSNATVCVDERIKLAIQRMVLTASETNQDREKRRRARQRRHKGLPNLVAILGSMFVQVICFAVLGLPSPCLLLPEIPSVRDVGMTFQHVKNADEAVNCHGLRSGGQL